MSLATRHRHRRMRPTVSKASGMTPHRERERSAPPVGDSTCRSRLLRMTIGVDGGELGDESIDDVLLGSAIGIGRGKIEP